MLKFKSFCLSKSLIMLCAAFMSTTALAENYDVKLMNDSILFSTLVAADNNETDCVGVYANSNDLLLCVEEGEDADINAIPSVPTKTGYKFNGFYTATTGGTQFISAMGRITDAFYDYLFDASQTDTLNLYAQWTPNTITIRWYGVKTVPSNAGFSAISNGVATSTVSYDGDIRTPVEAIVSSAGQTFIGWKFVND